MATVIADIDTNPGQMQAAATEQDSAEQEGEDAAEHLALSLHAMAGWAESTAMLADVQMYGIAVANTGMNSRSANAATAQGEQCGKSEQGKILHGGAPRHSQARSHDPAT